MRKFALLAAFVAAVLIGCGGNGNTVAGGNGGNGGNGGGNGGGGNGGGNGGGSGVVNLPSANGGTLSVAFFTGQGRALGDLSAVINHLSWQTADDRLDSPLSNDVVMSLAGYTEHQMNTNAPMGAALDFRPFDSFNLEVASLLRDNGNGSFTTITNNGQAVVTTEVPVGLHVLKGRTTTLPIFLNDSMITINNGLVNFNAAQFNSTNLDPASGTVRAFISDFVMFDITSVASKPKLSNGLPAPRVYFSGDNIAVSENPIGGRGVYEELKTSSTASGIFTMPVPVGTGVAPGTYTLVEQNLGDLSGLSKIMSLIGTWRAYNEVLVNLGTFEVVTFPNNSDSPKQQMIMMVRNAAGAITSFYFGTADLENLTFKAYPISNVVSGSAANQITGTLSGLVDQNSAALTGSTTPVEVGAVRGGTYKITGAAPAGFTSTGHFNVFRV